MSVRDPNSVSETWVRIVEEFLHPPVCQKSEGRRQRAEGGGQPPSRKASVFAKAANGTRRRAKEVRDSTGRTRPRRLLASEAVRR